MKRIIVSMILVLTALLVFASGYYYRDLKEEYDSKSDNSGLEDGVETEGDSDLEKYTENEATSNPFFFDVNGSDSIVYEGEFMFYENPKENLVLNVSEIAELEYGTVYELKFSPAEGIPYSRLDLGYFYVQKDKIYRVDHNKEDFDILLRDGLIPPDSKIVWQNSEMKDTLAESEKGFHQFITVDGDIIEYHSYSNLVETGWYESFAWEKGRGLVGYRSGFGAGRDGMDVKMVELISQ